MKSLIFFLAFTSTFANASLVQPEATDPADAGDLLIEADIKPNVGPSAFVQTTGGSVFEVIAETGTILIYAEVLSENGEADFQQLLDLLFANVKPIGDVASTLAALVDGRGVGLVVSDGKAYLVSDVGRFYDEGLTSASWGAGKKNNDNPISDAGDEQGKVVIKASAGEEQGRVVAPVKSTDRL